MSSDKAAHTIVVSDVHLSEAEPVDPDRPLWKRFKQRDLFVDGSFVRWLEALDRDLEGRIELVLNGDMFDFDSVMAYPTDLRTSWLERRRGLSAEESKSRFKLSVILRDHEQWLQGLRAFVLAGHSVVFVVGNHDLELHWPSVQALLVESLDLPEDRRSDVRVCEWFVISGGDTLISHGNQLDPYCLCQNPIHPLIQGVGLQPRVRLPFGNVAGRMMLNGMGLFNPHVDDSFIKPLRGYLVFFYRYIARVQPLIVWAWLWGAAATLVISVREGFLPALRDPFTIEERVESIATKARSTPRVARGLRALDVHPAIYNPWRILRELWLDRAILLTLVFWISFQLFSTLNVFVSVSWLWWAGAFVVLLPPFVLYAHRVDSEVKHVERNIRARVGDMARVAGVDRVVLGHTHVERHRQIDGVEVLNTGTWSAAYDDVECTRPKGRKCFAWIRSAERTAHLMEWTDPGWRELDPAALEAPRLKRSA